jgi:hypothetical protein
MGFLPGKLLLSEGYGFSRTVRLRLPIPREEARAAGD